QVRGVHDMAGSVVTEDGVILIFTQWRETTIAALLETNELFVSKVPATRSLVDIASNSTRVPYLRSADLSSRSDDGGILRRNFSILDEIDDLHRGADLHSAIRCRHDIRFQSILNIDHTIRLVDIILHPCQQILTACNRHSDAAGL